MTRSPEKPELPSMSLPHISRTGDGEVLSHRDVPVAVHLPGYAALSYLGRGAMGEVWRATQLSTKRTVAIKVMHDSIASRRAMQRFEREIELTARLEHPNIARVFDSGVHDGLYYYAMELIEGTRLDRYAQDRQLTVRQQLELLLKICRAMQHAHGRGVIHRDLKPSNILVRDNGEPCVLDFGLGFALDVSGDVTRLSRDGEVIGTLAYMSPEQARGDHPRTDARTDVYSIGVMVYQMMLGVNPHDLSGGVAAVSRRIAEEQIIAPRQMSRLIDRDLNRLIIKSLELDPDDRYPTIAALADDIARYLEGEPLQSQPNTVIYFLGKRLRKYRGRISAAALIVAVLLIVTALSIVRVVQERDRANAASALATANMVIAEENAAEARAQLARLYVSRGMERVDADDPAAGLPWLLAALKIESDHGQLTREHRMRLAMVQDMMPDIIDTQRPSKPIRSLMFNDDGRLLGISDRALIEVPGKNRNQKLLASDAILVRDDGRVALIRTGDATFALRTFDDTSSSRPLQGASDIFMSAFSPDGDTLITVTGSTITRWDVATGKQLTQWELPGAVFLLRFSPDGGELSTLAMKKTPTGIAVARIYDARTGEPTSEEVPGYDLRGAVILENGNLAVVRNKILSGQMYFQTQTFDRQGQTVGDATLTRSVTQKIPPRGQSILYTDDVSVRAMDLDTRRVRMLSPASETSNLTLQSNQAGDLLMGVWRDGSVRLWDVAAGKPLTPKLPHESGVQSWAVNSITKTLATSTQSGVLRYWHYGAKTPLVINHRQSIFHSVVSPDGKYLLACGADSVRLWHVSDGSLASDALAPGLSSTRGAFSNNGRLMATGHSDGSVRLWTVPDARLVHLILMNNTRSGADDIRFTPDGKQLITLSGGVVSVWNTVDGSAVYQLESGHVSMMTLSPDAKYIVTAIGDGKGTPIVQLWNAETGKKLGDLPAPSRLVMVAFTTDSRTVATFDPAGRVAAYRTDSLAATSTADLDFDATAAPVSLMNGLTWERQIQTAEGKHLIASNNQGISLTSFEGTPHVTHALSEGQLSRVTLSTSLGLAAHIDNNGSSRIWSLNTGEPITPRLSHDARPGMVAFTPDNTRMIVSESSNHVTTIRVLKSDEREVEEIEQDDVYARRATN